MSTHRQPPTPSLALLGASLLLFFCASHGSAQCIDVEDQVLLGSQVEFVDYFGASCDAAGDVAVIGAPHHNDTERDQGNAYAFRFNGASWVEEQVLWSGNPIMFESFGHAVATDANRIVVGAPQFAGSTMLPGIAYVFRWTGSVWEEEQALVATGGVDGDRFGDSVAIEGNRIVVGASSVAHSSIEDGSAYVFEFDGQAWSQVQELTALSASDGRFGTSVAIHGNSIFVGAPNDDSIIANGGTVEVFDFNGTSFASTQLLGPAVDGMYLGHDLGVDGNKMIVGTHVGERAYTYIYDGSSWGSEQVLMSSVPQANEFYGRSVDLDGDLAVVGAPDGDDGDLEDTGTVYTYRFDGTRWYEVVKLEAGAQEAEDFVGSSVAITGDNVLYGAEQDDSTGIAAGIAYSYFLPDLGLNAQPSTVQLGDLFDLLTCGGSQGHLALLFVVEFDGIPFTLKLFNGTFDADGRWLLPLGVPNDPALSGHTVTFQTLASTPAGPIAASKFEDLTIQ